MIKKENSVFSLRSIFTILFLVSSTNLHSQVTPKKCDDFINSIGLATHLSYSGVYSNSTNTKNQLLNLGIKHIRDGLDNKYSAVKEVANSGIKITGVLQGDFGIAAQTPAFWLKRAKDAGAMYAFEAFEGPNEADLPMMSFQYKGQGWPEGVRNFQMEMYNTVKNDPSISDRPVLGPTIGNGTKTSWAESMGDISAYVDYGNFHYYKAWGQTYSYGYPGWDLQSMINIHKTMFGTKPFMATEGSYHTATNVSGGISEALNAKYTLRYFMEYWRLGVVRTYKYELFDGGVSLTNGEDKFGLIENDGTTIKLAGTAVKDMITLLSEPSPSTTFTPTALDFTITNANSYTHYNLLQKSTGTYYLIIWNDAPSWDDNSRTEIYNNDFINIEFTTPVMEANLYMPCTNGTSLVSTLLNPTTFEVNIPNHPIIYEINMHTTLPLNLISFSAKATNSANKLLWTTGNEVNVKQFEVERSVDGTNFTQIGIQNSIGSGNYTSIDSLRLKGNNYYRLRIVEQNGESKFSNTIMVKGSFNEESEITIYPNPVEDLVKISVEDKNSISKVTLFDMQGKIMLTKEILGSTNLSLGNLAPGIYIVHIDCNGKIKTVKLIKK